MKKRIILVLVLVLLVMNFSACTNRSSSTEKDNKSEIQEDTTENNESEEIKINRKTWPEPYAWGKPASLDEIKNMYGPDYINYDFRGYDLQSLDLSQSNEDILECDFDCQTIWPDKLPEGFNPKKYLDFHKSPGLGLGNLHKKGITGKGINIAFIDYTLLVDHEQYKDRVKYYDAVHSSIKSAQMHAPAVVSIAAGKDTGVAPEADIFALECDNYNLIDNEMEIDASWTAQAIDKIIEINKLLPEDDKIRVLSVSHSYCPDIKGYDSFIEAVKKAQEENIFVVTCNLFETNNFYFQGLDMDPLCDKNDLSNYRVTEWKKWIYKIAHLKGTDEYYAKTFMEVKPKEILLLPIDCITVASQGGNEDYVFYRQGGWSWCMPYIAGLYALCCQVDNDITPKEFWTKALETGDEKSFENDGVSCIGKIVNPEKLIEAVKK